MPSTRTQSLYRAKYSTEVFKTAGRRHPSITDFNFSERVYYGRIDIEDDPVIPNNSLLVPIVSDAKPGELKYVFSFVKEMYNHFKSKFKQAALLGQIPDDDPFLSDIIVHTAFDNPISLYREHVSDIVRAFNEEYLGILDNAKSVMNFHDYNIHFLRFIKILGKNFPVTLTGFQKSKKSSIFTNGITISIADLDCGDDSLKDKFLLEKKCLSFYLNAAKQYGFAVMKNAPWILVADLMSVSTQLYLKKNGLSNIKTVFDRLYIKTYTLDLDILPSILQQGYSLFITNRKYEKDFTLCNNSTRSNNVYKETLNNNIINEKYNISYWLPVYVDIRNFEENNIYTEAESYRIKQKAISFEKLLDKKKSIRYINEQFRIKHKFADGGVAYYAERQKKRSEEK